MAEGLNRADGVQAFIHMNAHIGDALLGVAGKCPNPPPEDDYGQHHQRHHHQHHAGKHRAGNNQHHQAAYQKQDIAHRHGAAGPHHDLDQGGICGEPRKDLPHAGDLKETGGKRQHVVIDGAAEIGHHALTDP